MGLIPISSKCEVLLLVEIPSEFHKIVHYVINPFWLTREKVGHQKN